MRIGFFSDSYFPRKDGCSYTVKEWKNRLEERGHEVYVVYPASSSYEPDRNEIPVNSINNPWFKGHSIPLPLGTRKFPELDIVHCHSQGPLGIAARYYSWKNDLPSVYTFHTPIEDYVENILKSKKLSDIVGQAYVWLENRFMKTFDVITSNTGQINRNPDVIELPVGINTEFFHPQEANLLEELEAPVIGYSGRISEEKNLDQLLRLAEDFSGTVVIAGEGRYRSRLEKNAPENVHFMDFLPREKLPEFFSSLDIFITASDSDTLCLSALEANACGTPVVAPNLPPFDRTINGLNGMTYRPGDIKDFLEKVHACLEKELDPRSRAEDFSAVKTMDKLEEIYSGL